jgi:histidinol-phosphate aminotransferase
MYPFDTLLNAGQVVDVPRRADFSLDLERVLQAVREYKPKAVFLTAPNNPDGRFPSREEVEALLAEDLLVVIDEAYIEFTTEGGWLGERLSRIREVAGRGNLVVLRTFSKWAGLAGLRVGYGAFPNWMLPALWKAKQPYNVNVAATAAALASLADLDERAATVERLRKERERLYGVMAGTSFLRPFPSQANFILCQVLDRPAKRLKEELAKRGVLLRYYDNPLLRGYIRSSVGRPEDTDALAVSLASIAEIGD